MLKIIIDSTADLPKTFIEKYDIRIMPLHVIINDKEYRDRVDIQIDEVYHYMRQGIVPKTSQTPILEMYEIFDRCLKEGHDFIYLAFSSALSGTYTVATAVAEELKKKYPERTMLVIDSKSGAMGIGLIALQAAKMAEQGYPLEKITEQIRFLIDHVEHVFVISDLDWLTKGGRIHKVVGKAGSIIDVRPLIDVEDGRLTVIGAVRGRKKMIHTIANIVEERIKAFPQQLIGICHADDPEAAEDIKKLLQERLHTDNFLTETIGCVLGVHLGIGGVGVLFFNQKPDIYLE